MPQHIVLAYSGGLDTSVAVHWLKTHYAAKVTACIVDFGQQPDDLQDAADRAMANGAEACIVVPAKEIYANEYLAPAIQANALYQGAYPLGTALNRPLIAHALVLTAQQAGADAVAHGCTGKGNDQVRIEAGVKALAPGLEVLAPQRDFPMTRDQAIVYAKQNRLQLPPLSANAYSVDENLWTRSIEGGDLEDPSLPVNEAAYELTTSPFEAPDTPTQVTIGFEHGIPVSLDGESLDLATLVAALNQSAGANGIGRIDMVEDRLVGIKSREVYEAPAAVTILAAKKALESLTLGKDELLVKAQVEQTFAQATYDGQWFAPVMHAVKAFVRSMQAHVNGTVALQLYKGTVTVLSRQSPNSLFDAALATYGNADAFDHAAAKGFITLWALPQANANAARGAPTAAALTTKVLAGKPAIAAPSPPVAQ